MSAWALPLGQLFLTSTIAFAVYRVQADKLFLDMREKRKAALSQFRIAFEARFSGITQISKVNAGDFVLQPSEPALRLAEAHEEIEEWFGPEVVAASKGVMKALDLATDTKIKWCMQPEGQIEGYTSVLNDHLATIDSLTRMVTLCRPYVAAGKRGLPTLSRITVEVKARSLRRQLHQDTPRVAGPTADRPID